MATVSLARENYVLHKLHSLSGIIPVGFYMVQHLVLNSYSLAGPEKFNGVIHFFESLPPHILLGMEATFIWIPLIFHSIYGIFITGRAKQNFIGTKYGWSQNRMYTFQRATGIFIFIFLIVHVMTTTVAKYMQHDSSVLEYAAWYSKLTDHYYAWYIFYLLGILCCTYHLSYGIWNFCIRWGITISDEAQKRVQQLSLAVFLLLTVLGWGALTGFIWHGPPQAVSTASEPL